MLRLQATAFLAAGLALSSPAAQAESWRLYVNDRFGTTAEVPADWRMGSPPTNNDGRVFTSPDNRATITIAGMFHADDLTTIKDDMDLRAQSSDGTIAYQKRERRWIVVSGTKGDRIFYKKSVLSCGDTIWNDLWIEYPAGAKEKYAARVTRVAASPRRCAEAKDMIG